MNYEFDLSIKESLENNKLLDTLKPKWKYVMIKHFQHGKTLHEIGMEMKITRQAVHSIIHISLARIKNLIFNRMLTNRHMSGIMNTERAFKSAFSEFMEMDNYD